MNTTGTHRPEAGRRGSRLGLAAALAIGMVGSGVLVYQASFAAFTATTSNTGNSWETGSVDLADDDGGSALFSTAQHGLLHGGEWGERCITVTASGSLASTVTMSATATGTLAPSIELTVERAPATSVPVDCTGFDRDTSAPVYAGALSGLPAALTTEATSERWSATTGTAHTYLIRWELPEGDDAVVQNASAEAAFTWTATTATP